MDSEFFQLQIDRTIKGYGESIDTLSESSRISHERLAKLVTQVSLLFLSGWLLIFTSEKVVQSAGCTTSWIIVACFLHLSTIAIVALIDLSIIKSSTAGIFEQSKNMQEAVSDLNTLMIHQPQTGNVDSQNKVIEAMKSMDDRLKRINEYAESGKSAVAARLKWGWIAIAVFLISIALSCGLMFYSVRF